jgi:hypothetical protein
VDPTHRQLVRRSPKSKTRPDHECDYKKKLQKSLFAEFGIS